MLLKSATIICLALLTLNGVTGQEKPAPKVAKIAKREVSESEVEQISSTIQDTKSKSDGSNLMEVWEQNMQGFDVSDVMSFYIEPRHIMLFYEDVGVEPINIRGLFIVTQSSTASRDIDMYIIDEMNKTVYAKKGTSEGFFEFNTTKEGSLRIIFSNMKDKKGSKSVSLAYHTSRDEVQQEETFEEVPALNFTGEDGLIQSMDVVNLRKYLFDIDKMMQAIATESKLSQIRQNGVNALVEENNSSSFQMSILESIVFIVICGAQIFYIKNLLENKRLI